MTCKLQVVYTSVILLAKRCIPLVVLFSQHCDRRWNNWRVQTRAQCSWLTGLPGHVVRGRTTPFNPKSLFGRKRTMTGDVGGPSTCEWTCASVPKAGASPWGRVHPMSTPLLPDGAVEIDADPAIFRPGTKLALSLNWFQSDPSVDLPVCRPVYNLTWHILMYKCAVNTTQNASKHHFKGSFREGDPYP